jgi:hypothetical protein
MNDDLRLSTVRVPERPDRLEPGIVYVVGEGNDRFCAAMVCPCGCGADLYMSLVAEDDPSWRVTIHRDGTATLFPSIARAVGCRSHFVLRRGSVLWCRPHLSRRQGGERLATRMRAVFKRLLG